jgi:transcription elongation factor
MRSLKNPPELGKWVQVLRGTYKGNVGYVLSVTASEVHLLLIPRIAPKLKRHRTRPTLKLFNHKTHKLHYNIEPCRIHKKIYSVGNNRFEHGLIVRSYRFDAVSTGVSTIPLESFGLFNISGHPKLTSSKSAIPRPSEWCFLEGEEVYNLHDPIPTRWPEPPSYKSGFISKLRDDAVELDTKEGTVIVPWMSIYKVLRIGDFVEVMGGLHKEQKGWVNEVNLDCGVANIIRMVDERKPFSDHAEVRTILNENLFQVRAHILVRRSK